MRPRSATVVFVPGFMQRGDAWMPVAERVAERYPTRCLDLQGDTLATRLDEIRSAAAPGDALVGYSMGGRLVLHLAVRDPALFGGIVVTGANGGIESEQEQQERRQADDELAAWMETASIDEIVRRWEANPVFATQSPELVDAQRPGRLSHDPKSLASLLRSAGQGAMDPVWDRLPSLQTPVLAVAGELDERYAADARRMAELVPKGQARLVSDAGHAAHLERPDAFAELLLDFLDEHLGQGSVVDRDA
jgi:2-succinyl-6-hydroxy-2,4-cyclohexadiene-1-carboxylate synthase